MQKPSDRSRPLSPDWTTSGSEGPEPHHHTRPCFTHHTRPRSRPSVAFDRRRTAPTPPASVSPPGETSRGQLPVEGLPWAVAGIHPHRPVSPTTPDPRAHHDDAAALRA